jgi:hypothetical protein
VTDDDKNIISLDHRRFDAEFEVQCRASRHLERLLVAALTPRQTARSSMSISRATSNHMGQRRSQTSACLRSTWRKCSPSSANA